MPGYEYDHPRVTEVVAATLVVVGCVLRALQFRSGSLPWPAEASLYRMLELGWPELLFNPLDFSQFDAPGSLAATKLSLRRCSAEPIFGLRAVPFISSLIGLFLVWRVGRRLLRGPWVPVIVGVFAVNPIFILYASTPASFPLDLLVALAVLYSVLRTRELGFPPWAIAVTAVVGAVALFFSHYALLSLVGMWVALGMMAYERRDRATVVAWLSLGTVWVLIGLASMELGSPELDREVIEAPRFTIEASVGVS